MVLILKSLIVLSLLHNAEKTAVASACSSLNIQYAFNLPYLVCQFIKPVSYTHLDVYKRQRLGMEEICITDHHDYDVISEIDFTLDIPRYVEEITRVREEYKDRIHVNLGIELGLQCHLKEYLEQLAGRYPFDFIIGSSHFVNRIDPYYPAFYEGKSEDEAYRGYLDVYKRQRFSLLNPSKASSQNALVISLARSGRKLKKITESCSLITATGFPFSMTENGTTNSSVLSAS